MYEIAFVLKLSKFCNLRCTYCYEHRELHVRDVMALHVLGRLFAGIDSLGNYLNRFGVVPKFSFVFHGGEPLLLPPDYYRQIAALQKQHIRAFDYRNSVQTNLHGINQATLDLVLDTNWELGVSIDFAADVRVNAGGRDSNAKVIAAAEDLHRAGVRFGAISVLGAHNRDRLCSGYDWVAEFAEGWRILPIFEGGPDAGIARLRLSEAEVARVFLDLFEKRAAASKHIPIAPLDDYIKAAALKIAGPRKTGDVTRALLDNIFLINVNGDVFTRPFAYAPDRCLGNITRQPLSFMLEDQTYRTCQEIIRQRKLRNCGPCAMQGFCDSSFMHEHGAVSAEDEGGDCLVHRRAMRGIENILVEAGINSAVIGDWARQWLAASQTNAVVA